MASAKRDRRRVDIAKFLETYEKLGAPPGSAAEQAVWVILARHGSKDGATRAMRSIWRRYVDINELRVASGPEIAAVIARNVRNDAMHVANQVRGFLRRFHKDHHTTDFGITGQLTPDQLKRYLNGTDGFVEEIALAVFLHESGAEVEAQAELAAADAADTKPRKRPERDITSAAKRLRITSSYSAHGAILCKAKLVNCARCLLRAWSYAPLPAEAAPRPKKKKKAAKKAVAKKASARGGGTARPRTARTTRVRSASKKSSRR